MSSVNRVRESEGDTLMRDTKIDEERERESMNYFYNFSFEALI